MITGERKKEKKKEKKQEREEWLSKNIFIFNSFSGSVSKHELSSRSSTTSAKIARITCLGREAREQKEMCLAKGKTGG